MYEITTWVDGICTIALKISAIVSLWYFINAIRYWSKNQQKKPEPVPVMEAPKVLLEEKPVEPVEQTPVAVSIPAQAAVPQPVADPGEVIECGSCHQDIKSNPVTTMSLGNEKWAVYVCEHCNAQVKLPA